MLGTGLRDQIISRFAMRALLAGSVASAGDVHVLANSTEELVDAASRGKSVRMFAMGNQQRRIKSGTVARLEENYLYSSRRFPALTNNTIGGGGLAQNTYPFFQVAKGTDGNSAGFPTGFTLTSTETNMELAGQIPQGQSFVFSQLGVSFNSQATVADTSILMDNCILQFTRSGGSFTMDQGPAKLWPGGTGNGGQFGTMTAAATSQFGANGSPDIRAVRTLRIARVLKANDVFAYNFVVNRSTLANDGTSIALSAFVVATIWLWGGWNSAIAS